MPVVVAPDDAAILAAAIEVTDDFGLVLDGDELVDAAGARWPLDTLTALVSARCAAFDESKVVREHGRFGHKDTSEKEPVDKAKYERAAEAVDLAPSVKYGFEPDFRSESRSDFEPTGPPNGYTQTEKEGSGARPDATMLGGYDEQGNLVSTFDIATSGPAEGAFKVTVRDDAQRQGYGMKLLAEVERRGIVDLTTVASRNRYTEEGRALVSAYFTSKARTGAVVDLPHSSLGRARLAFDESKVVRESGRFTFKDDSEKEPAAREFHGPVTEPVKVLADGKAAYLESHGLQSSGTDFATVTVDPQMQADLADAFDAMPLDDPASHEAYDQLGAQTAEQFDYLTNTLGISVSTVDHDPYATVADMVADVRDNGHLDVLATSATGSHGYLTDEQNDQFRAVHDAFGHAAIGRGFDRDGEEAAFQSHAEMFTGSAVRALASETRGQNAVLITRGEFPPQKVGLLPEGAELVSANRGALTAAPIPPGDADRDNLYDETHVHHVSLGRRLPSRRTVPASVRAAIERVRARLAVFDESKVVREAGRFAPKDKDEEATEDEAVQDPSSGVSNELTSVFAIEGWQGAGPEQSQVMQVGMLKIDEARQAGVFTNPADGQPLKMGYDPDRHEAKAMVAHDIAERMSSVSTEELYGVAFRGWGGASSDFSQVVAFEFEANAGGWRPIVGEERDPDNPYQQSQVWRDNPEFDRIARESAAGTMVHEWAGTSNDNSITSLAIQDTVEAHFGLEGVYPWDQESFHVRDQVESLRAEHGDTLDAFVTAQYEGTQEFFREVGISELDLARGMDIDPEHSSSMGDDIDVDMRPLSSFSTDADTAASFGSDVQLFGRVPVDRVFATPFTGVGCLNENEVVVIGGGSQHFGITGEEKDPQDTYNTAAEAMQAYLDGTPYEVMDGSLQLEDGDVWMAQAVEPYTGDTIVLDAMADSDEVSTSDVMWDNYDIEVMQEADSLVFHEATEGLPVTVSASGGYVEFADPEAGGSTSIQVEYDAANPERDAAGVDAERIAVGVEAITMGHMNAAAMDAVIVATPGMENVGTMRAYTTVPTGVQALNPELDKFDARSTLGVLQNPEVTGGLISAGGYSTALMAHSTYDKGADEVTVNVTKGGDSVAHPSEPVATTTYTMEEFKADPAAVEAAVTESVANQVREPQQQLDLATAPADNEPGNDPSKVEPF